METINNKDNNFLINLGKITDDIFNKYERLIKLELNNQTNTSKYLYCLFDLAMNIEIEKQAYKALGNNPILAAKFMNFIINNTNNELQETIIVLYEKDIETIKLTRIMEQLFKIASNDTNLFFNLQNNSYIVCEDYSQEKKEYCKNALIAFDAEFARRNYNSFCEHNNILEKHFYAFMTPYLEEEILHNRFKPLENNFEANTSLLFNGDQDFLNNIKNIYGLQNASKYIREISTNFIDDDLYESDLREIFEIILEAVKSSLLFLEEEVIDSTKTAFTTVLTEFNENEDITEIIRLINKEFDNMPINYKKANKDARKHTKK